MNTQGIAAHVPFLAHPPRSGGSGELVVVWPMLDPPRNELAMASALPLDGVDAWRVYLQLPSHTFQNDPVLDVFGPVVEQTVDRFPAVLKALRREFPVGDGPVKLVGASISSLAVLELAGDPDVGAAALISPTIQLSGLVAANEAAFGMAYPWSDASRALADRYDFLARADELAKHNVPILLVTGEHDDANLRDPAERLWQQLPGISSLVTVPGMGHALAEEPGVEPAPQTAHAAKVDAIVADWLSRH
ncbi:alpha/beta fold hydrolase [Allorhizocola rhizosphaerae]|uniref:alpha/beta fold hydrolase n=1 Tax=Allorhizocola rhizosphaerae TaxID=1872709 RepID=UPI000E3BCDD4|nr:alpha/beta hydrolase [Allorhizocola rhizosphaerae]